MATRSGSKPLTAPAYAQRKPFINLNGPDPREQTLTKLARTVLRDA